MTAAKPLSVLAIGPVSAASVAELAGRFQPFEQSELAVPRDAPLSTLRPEINRAADAASSPWLLILRAGESADDALAAEIDGAMGSPPAAWGYRIRTQVCYCGRPLLLERSPGEIRLVHRRHCRFVSGATSEEMKVEGPVVRLRNGLVVNSFGSGREHREFLAARGVPHSSLRRVLLFLRRVAGTGAWRSANALRYLWIEAGWDLSEVGPRDRQ